MKGCEHVVTKVVAGSGRTGNKQYINHIAATESLVSPWNT